METAKIVYQGNLRTQGTHLKSGSTIITDAPTDNHGKGEAFSPTDLLATSLACCMLTLMGIKASQHNFEFEYSEASITKHMGVNPRKVEKVEVTFSIPDQYSAEEKEILEQAALNCPVAKSLSAELQQEVLFKYV